MEGIGMKLHGTLLVVGLCATLAACGRGPATGETGTGDTGTGETGTGGTGETGTGETSPWDVDPREDTMFQFGEISNPRDAFSPADETVVDVDPQVPGYTLPLLTTDIVNLDRDVREKGIHPVTGDAEAKLGLNGFVIVPAGVRTRFAVAYKDLEEQGVPMFVTADSVLHLYHLFFDQILQYLEITEFNSGLSTILYGLTESSLAQYQGFDGDLEEAARRNVAFVSVAAKLLDPDFPVPGGVPEVAAELELIEAAEALAASPLMNYDCPAECGNPCAGEPLPECAPCTCEDYTQYIPRGHYTVSEELERYFKAMMWLGRIGMRMCSDMETIQAVLLVDALNRAEVDAEQVADLWYRIYDVTGFLVGASDDLTFFEYQEAVLAAFGAEFDMVALEEPDARATLREKLDELRDPAILGGFLSVFLDETEATKGLRFMGQRFAPDSYVLGQMVWDHIGPDLTDPRITDILEGCGAASATCPQILDDLELSTCICTNALVAGMPELCRLLPKGLDVMAALGSAQARTYLEPDYGYCGFEESLDGLVDEFAAYTRDDWRQSVYWYWLDVLTPLIGGFEDGYPNWMRTDAWATKELSTTLTSWAELRHDTILYVKQSYTGDGGGGVEEPPPEAFRAAEPVPHFFARLGDLATYTRDGLTSHEAMPSGLDPHIGALVGLLEELTVIAVDELEGRELTEDQYEFLGAVGERFAQILAGLGEVVGEHEADPECEEYPDECENEVQEDAYKTTIVADVHTDPNTESVLEEASGYVEWVIVARELPDGTIGASVGPVFSYYEFPHPMNDRLTDEAWRTMLSTNPPARPEWLDSIRSE
jgi:hypothetical protein